MRTVISASASSAWRIQRITLWRGGEGGRASGGGRGGVSGGAGAFKKKDGIRDLTVTGVQTCALPILDHDAHRDLGVGVERVADPAHHLVAGQRGAVGGGVLQRAELQGEAQGGQGHGGKGVQAAVRRARLAGATSVLGWRASYASTILAT